MRECLFFVADKNIRFALEGFFKRDGFHHGLGCAPFDLDPARDIRVAVGQNDPGLYARANLLIQPFRPDYRRVVIILDVEWEGSPGKSAIVEKINGHIRAAGWQAENGHVIVVEPEADNWLWTDTPHTAAALGWENMNELRRWLAEEGDWPHDAPKPPRPKETAEKALRKVRKPRSSTIYREAAGRVSLKRCQDPSVHELAEAFRRWFPMEAK